MEKGKVIQSNLRAMITIVSVLLFQRKSFGVNKQIKRSSRMTVVRICGIAIKITDLSR